MLSERPVSETVVPLPVYITKPLPKASPTLGDVPSVGFPVTAVEVVLAMTTLEKSPPGFVQPRSIWPDPGVVEVEVTSFGERLSIVIVALVPSVPEEALDVGVKEIIVLVTA